MAGAVWKTSAAIADEITIDLPLGSTLLSVGAQTGMGDRLLNRATVEGATLLIGPAGLRPLRALLDGEGTPEQMKEYAGMLDAAIAADEATKEPESPDV
jgi:hypothetical protein